MISDNNGNIYTCGGFQNNFGEFYIAKNSGTNWAEVGLGINTLHANDGISTLCFDKLGNLYAGGGFANTSGNRYVAKWDGSIWSEVGGTNSLVVNSIINSVYVNDSLHVYVGGVFVNANFNCYVAKYDGLGWTELGGANSLGNAPYISEVTGDKLGNIYTCSALNSIGGLYVAKFGNYTSVNELNSDLTILTYPNPATDYVQIFISKEINCNATICNTVGEVVYHQAIQNQNDIKINTATFPAGIYYLRLISDKINLTKKFIKQSNSV